MIEEIRFLISLEAANVLGVNVSSIKRWTDAGKLECIQTAGGHRKFLMSHLVQFIEKHEKNASHANVFPIECEADVDISYHVLKGDFEYLIEYVQERALISDRTSTLKVMNALFLAQYPLHMIYDKLIAPVLQRIGTLWMNEKISVIEEHIAAQTIRESISRLQGIIRLPEEKKGRAIFVNLSSELHDIGLKMAENILEMRGFETYFSGQMTPFIKIEQLFDKIRPDRLYISSTYVSDRDETQDEINSLCAICQKYKTGVFVGGRGWDILNYDHPVVIKRLYHFSEMHDS